MLGGAIKFYLSEILGEPQSIFLIAFPKILANVFLVPRFLSVQKQQAFKNFLYYEVQSDNSLTKIGGT